MIECTNILLPLFDGSSSQASGRPPVSDVTLGQGSPALVQPALSFSLMTSVRCWPTMLTLLPGILETVKAFSRITFITIIVHGTRRGFLASKCSCHLIRGPCVEPVSPQPSVDRLSVTFAAEEPSVISMEKVRFEPDNVPSEAEEDEDYSQSVSAIFQRKASTRRSRKRRRSSSPLFTQEAEDNQNGVRNRRRSSVFTTSSGDTAISVEDAVQEQILQNIKLHKEVLSSVKQQPWNMRRKLRLVRQAQAYIRRHEGELQERLAQSRSTRDILARFNIVLIKHWQHTKRELANLMNVLIPWEIRIKEIESHFGSVVASYFTFLRWLFWVNLVTAVVLIVFVAVPEMLMANKQKAGMRKKMTEDEKANATNLFTLWDFDGVLRYSPLFYGYYSNQDPEDKSLAKSIGYRMPLAYFLTELVVYIYSFVAILRRMAENSRQSKLSEKDDECVFTWKLFTGWDYMIGNSETAHNRTASIILGFKEALLEEAEKKRDEGRNWKVTSLRVFAHLNVLWLLGSSVYAVILVVHRSTQPEAENGWWRKNEITIVVSLITTLFPAFFEVLGIIEQYHPRKKLRMQLARIMALNLLNIYTLIFASFSKINEMSNTLQALRPKNDSFTTSQPPSAAYQVGAKFPKSLSISEPYTYEWNSTLSTEKFMNCRNITVPCSSTTAITMMTVLMSVLAANSTFTPLSSNDGHSFSSVSTLPSTPLYNSSSQNLTTSSQLTGLDDTTSTNLGMYSSLDPYSTTDFAVEFDGDQINDFKDSDEFLSVDSSFTDSTVSESVQESGETAVNTNVPSLSETTQLTELTNNDVTVENSTPSDNYPSSIELSTQDFDFTSSSTSSDSVSPESTLVEQICIKTVCDTVPSEQSTTTRTDQRISLPVSTTQTMVSTTPTTTTSNTGLVQCIDKPTRVTEKSQSSIDHIFVRYSDMTKVKAAIFQTAFTDHYSTALTITETATDTDTQLPPRTYVDHALLTDNLAKSDWEAVLNCEILANNINPSGDPVVTDEDYRQNSCFTLHTVTEEHILRHVSGLRGGKVSELLISFSDEEVEALIVTGYNRRT
ncbi:Transmembrane channel-like protein 3 [Homalodisca vitripennis]|nr:Transmembrane channel-like protein 3 [Homalodisca vitripennis]